MIEDRKVFLCSPMGLCCESCESPVFLCSLGKIGARELGELGLGVRHSCLCFGRVTSVCVKGAELKESFSERGSMKGMCRMWLGSIIARAWWTEGQNGRNPQTGERVETTEDDIRREDLICWDERWWRMIRFFPLHFQRKRVVRIEGRFTVVKIDRGNVGGEIKRD